MNYNRSATLIMVVNIHPNYFWMINSYLQELEKYNQVQVIIWNQYHKRRLELVANNVKLVLIGSFRDFSIPRTSEQNLKIDSDLLRIFELNLGENFWHIVSDLDNSVSNLLKGETLREIEYTQIEYMEPNLLDVFSGIIWGYEDLPEEINQVNIEVWKFRNVSPEFLKFRKVQLQETRDFLRMKFKKRITWHHCIKLPPRQFLENPLTARRPHDIALIGSMYSSRLAALEMLRRSGLKIYPHHNFLEEDLPLLRVVRKYRSSESPIRNRNSVRTEYFLQQLGYLRSSAAWVDPGYFGYFVRKYLEAAASGAALVGYPNSLLRNLGLEHARNFFEITSQENLTRSEIQYLSDHASHRTLALNAWAWIDNHHSAKVRARQMIEALEDVDNKYIFGFYNGTFKKKLGF